MIKHHPELRFGLHHLQKQDRTPDQERWKEPAHALEKAPEPVDKKAPHEHKCKTAGPAEIGIPLPCDADPHGGTIADIEPGELPEILTTTGQMIKNSYRNVHF